MGKAKAKKKIVGTPCDQCGNGVADGAIVRAEESLRTGGAVRCVPLHGPPLVFCSILVCGHAWGYGERMTPELKDKLAGRRVVASVSGGKDSAAMSLWLAEQDIEHERVFLDTGWEHATTYDYLRGELTAKLGPIIEIRGKLGKAAQGRVDALLLGGRLRPRVRAALLAGSLMVALIISRDMFPSKRRRFCTQELGRSLPRRLEHG